MSKLKENFWPCASLLLCFVTLCVSIYQARLNEYQARLNRESLAISYESLKETQKSTEISRKSLVLTKKAILLDYKNNEPHLEYIGEEEYRGKRYFIFRNESRSQSVYVNYVHFYPDVPSTGYGAMETPCSSTQVPIQRHDVVMQFNLKSGEQPDFYSQKKISAAPGEVFAVYLKFPRKFSSTLYKKENWILELAQADGVQEFSLAYVR